jgi:hypothetical protein
MARKKKTEAEALAAITNYNTQLTALNSNIAGVQGGLLNMADVGQASYYNATKETALTKKDQLNFSDVYNPLYEKMKDVRFTVGEDITTANNDAAFYVFNPETEAKRQTDEQMGAITKQNEEFDLQQQRITEFLKQSGEAQKVGVLEQYLASVTKNAQTGYIKSTDAGFDMDAYKAARNRDKSFTYDANRNKIYSYKLPEEVAAAKLQTLRDVETLRFRSDPTVQQNAATKYAATLEEQRKELNKKLRNAGEYVKKLQRKANRNK